MDIVFLFLVLFLIFLTGSGFYYFGIYAGGTGTIAVFVAVIMALR